MQDWESQSINSLDISISRSLQLEYAIPAAKISALSSVTVIEVVSYRDDGELHPD